MQTINLSTQKKNRIFYFDLLKAFACISVVFIHISAIDWHNTPVNSLNWTCLNFYNSFSRWGVPVFFMISGALLLGNANNLSLDKLYKKSILRFCAATVVWSAGYAVLSFLLGGDKKAFISVLIGGEYHIWFMFSIIGLYVFAPILNEFLKNKRIVQYSLIVFFLFSFVFKLPDILLAFDVPHIQFFILQLKDLVDQFGFLTNTEYLFYFILGYFLHNTELSRKKEKILLILMVLLALIITNLQCRMNM
jgi:surface polysaccharide O-acyltransferase-like enzyme